MCVRRRTVRNGAALGRGFTLIEVLMAAFVMAIGVLGLTALFAGAARQQQLSSQSTRTVAHARSAEAFISKRFGPLENMDGTATLRLGSSLPRNGQGPNDAIIQTDQWYAIPRNLEDGSITVNPTESKDGWKNESVFSRSEPREVLPRLMFRTRVELAENQFVSTGRAGGNKSTQVGLGTLDDDAFGAPAFDASMRELRVIADSIKIRVVTREFPCTGTNDERSVVTPDDTEIVLRFDESVVPGNPDDIHLIGDDGESKMILVSKRDAKDADLGTNNGETKVRFAYIADVVNGLPNDPGCGAAQEYWVALATPTPSPCDNDGATEYLWQRPDGTGDIDPDPFPGSGNPGYDIKAGTAPGERYLYGQLRKVDRCNIGSAMYTRVAAGTGDYVLSGDGVNPPQPGDVLQGPVRQAQFPTRFIHEIWLDDYRYRAHTLVSLPESVTYSQAGEDVAQRVPQLGYSMLFRRTADSEVQYAVFSYAISPTYPATADKVDRTDDDYFPMEDKTTIQNNLWAPLRLVKGVAIDFDTDLGQFYVVIDTSAGNNAEIPAWVASPGTVLLFNGDSSVNPPIPGADAPVRIVNTRKAPDAPSLIRAYLDGPPRAGLRSLSDFGSGNTFDAWVVSPKCLLTQRKKGAMTYHWGLKPIEARIFTVGQ